ncbi:single-stranded DNA-binding protein [Brevibacterium sp. UMB1308A]|uniref:single-stranded DNA-binding protein n=1 Tax=Brevibacterium sp. UMB1308A TaxID=3050608 RepID=UPI00254CF0A2|nr:single-stranded DNA-binding protein [Brevibacterium sp. UMB1308A]MDK8345459.1 single-stranded DNA-binding protein [Brevibacterium sp. UMB1308B]MDK8712695.1 single-stranded DNA-binding protein [Brevibacterium sp. UMB1308A]
MTEVTLIGNLTADPELRFTPSGKAVANFTVANTPRVFDKQAGQYVDGEPMFLRCNAWKYLAENVAETLAKGNRVIVQGKLKSRSFEDKEGNKRTVFEVDVTEVGPSLKFATATVQRNQPQQTQQQSQWGQPQQAQQPQQDPWQGTPTNAEWGEQWGQSEAPF